MTLKILKFTFLLLLFFAHLNSVAQYQLKRADKLFNKEAFIDAAGVYKKIAQKDSTNAYVQGRIGDCYRLIARYDLAEIWYAKAVKSGSKDPDLFLNYADVLKSNDKFNQSNEFMAEYQQLKKGDSRPDRQLENTEYYLELLDDSARYNITHLNLNTDKSDFGPTYFKNKLVFASARDDRFLKREYKRVDEPFLDLYIANILPSGQLDSIKFFARDLNSNVHEGPACFTPDGKTMYFTRNNYLKRGTTKNRVNRLKIYMSKWNGEEWSEPLSLPFNSDEYSCGHPAITADGQTLYFSSDMDGGIGLADIYRVRKMGDSWSEPENLGEKINTEGNEMFPFIDGSGNLYYASDGLPGLGGHDIFLAENNNQGFAEPQNMGYPLNSKMDDFSFVLSNDRFNGYFASNRYVEKSDDLFAVQIVPTPPKTVIDTLTIDKNVANKIILPLKNDKHGYFKYFELINFDSISAQGGKVSWDAKTKQMFYTPKQDYFGMDTINYVIADTCKIIQGVDTGKIIITINDYFFGVEGLVVYKKNRAPVDSVKITLFDFMERAIATGITQKDGKVKFTLDKNSDYSLTFRKRELLTKTVYITTRGMPQGVQKVEEIIELQELKIGEKFAVSIYFDTGKHDIRPDAAVEINKKILKFLLDNPTVKIELSAHTDSRGSKTSNQRLSQQRANSTVAYLVKNGIAPGRMKSVGYGESQLTNKCKDGVRCSEEEHQANRRVEVKIIGY